MHWFGLVSAIALGIGIGNRVVDPALCWLRDRYRYGPPPVGRMSADIRDVTILEFREVSNAYKEMKA